MLSRLLTRCFVTLCISANGIATSALPEISLLKQNVRAAKGHTTSRVLRRSGAPETSIAASLREQWGSTYFASVELGTPPQQLGLQIITTAYGDTYVMDPNACGGQYVECTQSIFDWRRSSSYTADETSPTFNITYTDTNYTGVWSRDVLQLGNIAISDFAFGVADTVYVRSQGSFTTTRNRTHASFMDVMVSSDAIKSRLFSIYLDELSSSGSLLFGGVDASKFSGQLSTLNLVPPNNSTNIISDFMTSVVSFGVSSGSGLWENLGSSTSSSIPPGWLIVGSSTMTIPQDSWNDLLINTLSFVNISSWTCSCDHRSDDINVTITFKEGWTIHVPAQDFLEPIYNSSTGQPVVYTNGTAQCGLLIVAASSDAEHLSLGDPVLRRLYAVFDMDNAQISIANAVINSTASPDIRVVQAGPSGVANAAGPVVTAPMNIFSITSAYAGSTTFSLSTISTSSSVSSSATSTQHPVTSSSVVPTNTATPGPSGLSRTAKIGVGVGAAMGVLALAAIAAGVALFLRGRRNAEDLRPKSELMSSGHPSPGPNYQVNMRER